MEHDPKLLHNIFQFLIDIRDKITPIPIHTVLILKELEIIIRVVIRDKEGILRGYDLELTYYDSLLIDDMDLVVRTCVQKANMFFKAYT